MYRLLLSGALLFALAVAQEKIQAWEKPPVKVDCQFNFRVNVRLDPVPGCCPPAPWWCYFPHDPCQAQKSTTNTYPNWPQPFPPKDDATKQTSRFPSWPSKTVAQSQLEPMSAPMPNSVINGFQLTSASRSYPLAAPSVPIAPMYHFAGFAPNR